MIMVKFSYWMETDDPRLAIVWLVGEAMSILSGLTTGKPLLLCTTETWKRIISFFIIVFIMPVPSICEMVKVTGARGISWQKLEVKNLLAVCGEGMMQATLKLNHRNFDLLCIDS